MRIIIDMQGAQGVNRQRGIGRYTASLVKAIIKNRQNHEIILALNGMLTESIEPIRIEFGDLLPAKNIQTWYAPSIYADNHSEGTQLRRKRASIIRESFIANLKPDFVLITSLFEGQSDAAITDIGTSTTSIQTATILYDLIPLIFDSPYLDNPDVRAWYENKLKHLRRSDLLLSISESSRQEAIQFMEMPAPHVRNISSAIDDIFEPIQIPKPKEKAIRERFGLSKAFILYTGGIDHRKNIEGLIESYAELPLKVRKQNQLVIVCSIQEHNREKLSQLIKSAGLQASDVALTGHVSDEELLHLYNLCTAFIFPSKHEGFGLPALEAMSCGKAVIGSNASSIPEVIGLPSALFDPNSKTSITNALNRVLTDPEFKKSLEEHSLEQAKKFSWDKTAQIAINEMERHLEEKIEVKLPEEKKSKPKLAYVSPLPPARSGISEYSLELLSELSKLYQIELISSAAATPSERIPNELVVRSPKFLSENVEQYDRVIYHFGNSEFHDYMFDLIEQVPGVIVLHDFFLSGIVAHLDTSGSSPCSWSRALYQSHGYHALKERFFCKDTADVVWKYPCNLAPLNQALGVIVHSDYSRQLADAWYGSGASENWRVIPLLRIPANSTESSRSRLELNENQLVVCSFGIIGPHKLNQNLLDCWLSSSLASDPNCILVFVGDIDGSEYSSALMSTIKNSGLENRIKVTGWVNNSTFNDYLNAADISVQLRTLSRGETSAAVLDCMNHGTPTIINRNGSMAEIQQDAVLSIPDDFENSELTEALEVLASSSDRRKLLGENAREMIRKKHNPAHCAQMYFESIENFHRQSKTNVKATIKKLAETRQDNTKKEELVELADSIDKSIPPSIEQRQLFIDISELIQSDAKTGIQRVVKNILNEWLKTPPKGIRIEAVYASLTQGYMYAREFTLDLLGCSSAILSDEPISFSAGDIFLGLDLQPSVVCSKSLFYQDLRNKGVQVKFCVYDLLCISLPHYFVDGAKESFSNWLDVISENDGAICISKSVADELETWISSKKASSLRKFDISHFRLGANINQVATTGFPTDFETTLKAISANNSFIVVGTLEPRKGHQQTLEAFESLWEGGHNLNCVFVGKQGWMMEDLAHKIKSHVQFGKKLFWLEGISDEYLQEVYKSSTCLIAPSEGEGFGLPLVEASENKLPIIARKIPVFVEVAGDGALYFEGKKPSAISQKVLQWLDLFESGQHPDSKKVTSITWNESANQLLKTLL